MEKRVHALEGYDDVAEEEGYINQEGSDKCIFVVRMHWFFLASDTIDILCLVYSNFCTNEIILQIYERPLTNLK